MTGFRDIVKDEETKLLRHISAIFMPHLLGQSLSKNKKHYASRPSPLLIDLVLPRFMPKAAWTQLCHSQGFGVGCDVAWDTARQLVDLSPKIELAYGGDEMMFRHFNSDAEYSKLLDEASNNPVLNSLAYLPLMVKWRHRRVCLPFSRLFRGIIRSGREYRSWFIVVTGLWLLGFINE